jgi:hypothetical protein
VMERLEGSRLLKHPYYRQTQRLKGMGSTEHGPKRLSSRASASSPAIFLFFAASRDVNAPRYQRFSRTRTMRVIRPPRRLVGLWFDEGVQARVIAKMVWTRHWLVPGNRFVQDPYRRYGVISSTLNRS